MSTSWYSASPAHGNRLCAVVRVVDHVRGVSGVGCRVWGAVIVGLFLVGCGSSGGSSSSGTVPAPVGAHLSVSSPDLQDGARIDPRFTCDGAGDRPVIRWSGVPSRAVEVAVLVDDPDAPSRTFV